MNEMVVNIKQIIGTEMVSWKIIAIDLEEQIFINTYCDLNIKH